jgi:hypothetical protein
LKVKHDTFKKGAIHPLFYFIVVELAKLLEGENWQQEFLDKVKKGGIEEVLM